MLIRNSQRYAKIEKKNRKLAPLWNSQALQRQVRLQNGKREKKPIQIRNNPTGPETINLSRAIRTISAVEWDAREMYQSGVECKHERNQPREIKRERPENLSESTEIKVVCIRKKRRKTTNTNQLQTVAINGDRLIMNNKWKASSR